MDFMSFAKIAIELGVIPAIALFLIFSFHKQNTKLVQMLQEREKMSMELIKIFSEHILILKNDMQDKG